MSRQLTPIRFLSATGLLALASAFMTSVAFADYDGERRRAIDHAQHSIAAAIEQGRYNGNLTRREYRQLIAEHARVGELILLAKRDGYVSHREFYSIRHAQTTVRQQVQAEAGNGKVSLWRRWLYRTRY